MRKQPSGKEQRLQILVVEAVGGEATGLEGEAGAGSSQKGRHAVQRVGDPTSSRPGVFKKISVIFWIRLKKRERMRDYCADGCALCLKSKTPKLANTSSNP